MYMRAGAVRPPSALQKTLRRGFRHRAAPPRLHTGRFARAISREYLRNPRVSQICPDGENSRRHSRRPQGCSAASHSLSRRDRYKAQFETRDSSPQRHGRPKRGPGAHSLFYLNRHLSHHRHPPSSHPSQRRRLRRCSSLSPRTSSLQRPCAIVPSHTTRSARRRHRFLPCLSQRSRARHQPRAAVQSSPLRCGKLVLWMATRR